MPFPEVELPESFSLQRRVVFNGECCYCGIGNIPQKIRKRSLHRSPAPQYPVTIRPDIDDEALYPVPGDEIFIEHNREDLDGSLKFFGNNLICPSFLQGFDLADVPRPHNNRNPVSETAADADNLTGRNRIILSPQPRSVRSEFLHVPVPLRWSHPRILPVPPASVLQLRDPD